MSNTQGILLETGTNELEIIEFGLQYRRADGTVVSQPLGINVTKVREIVRMEKPTAVPQALPGIRGMITLRDQVIPVLDLGYYLYGEQSAGGDCCRRRRSNRWTPATARSLASSPWARKR